MCIACEIGFGVQVRPIRIPTLYCLLSVFLTTHHRVHHTHRHTATQLPRFFTINFLTTNPITKNANCYHHYHQPSTANKIAALEKEAKWKKVYKLFKAAQKRPQVEKTKLLQFTWLIKHILYVTENVHK
jgi:hypothetical protein